MSVTINDVAKEAGVSITTVSRVLNNNYPVKKETRLKIEKAIEKLNYKPNVMARSLITKKTAMIGVVVPGITNIFFPTIVEAIEKNIKHMGYNISLSNTTGDAFAEKDIIENIIARQVDGIIVIDPRRENIESGYYEDIAENLPVVVINGYPHGEKCSFVCYDEEIGSREAFEYLISLGHKKIAFVRGHKSYSYDIKEKVYLETLDNNNLNYKKILDVGMGNSIEVVDSTQKLVEEMLRKGEIPTAIFACNDLMAVGAMNACSNLDIKVPQDVSIIGCDNTMIANISNPRLCSVDLDMNGIGKRAAEEMLKIIDNNSAQGKNITIKTKLIVRESCSRVNN